MTSKYVRENILNARDVINLFLQLKEDKFERIIGGKFGKCLHLRYSV